MVISFVVAVWFQFGHRAAGLPPLHPSLQLVLGVAVTTAVWLAATLLTRPTDAATLQDFYDRIRPYGRGWSRVADTSGGKPTGGIAPALACWILGCAVVYAALFGTGYLLYGSGIAAAFSLSVAAGSAIALFRILPGVSFE